MKEQNQFNIIGWSGLGIMLMSAIMTTFLLSMATYLLKTNPDLDINLIIIHGKLVDVFPFILFLIPIAFYPFTVYLFLLYKIDKLDKMEKTQ